RLKCYPPPQELPSAIGGGAPHLVFLDVFSERDQALVLIEEMVKLGSLVQVIALLGENDPDLVLRCLRAGAKDFLIQPFSGEQIEGALSTLARLQTTSDSAGKEPAKFF